jgi:hypothetical protein
MLRNSTTKDPFTRPRRLAKWSQFHKRSDRMWSQTGRLRRGVLSAGVLIEKS